ncbi:MAG: hypothetical protein EBU66_05570 [Bacteroidetes bacterium]|nr:hypothetical protein [bacterium]NBP64131.1 hypothetical protein [Bacteroidota bacterium]
MEVWSSIFTHESESEWATCSLPIDIWKRVMDQNPATRLVARIRYNTNEVYIALGSPVELEGEKIFIPNWFLDHLGVSGSGEIVDVEWLAQDAFPEATRIILRPEDSAFYHSDAKEELECSLTRLGVLRTGDTIVIPMKCLGGYEIAFHVVVTEPANIVLAHGDEVVIEFEESLDTIAPPTAVVEGRRIGGETRMLDDGRRWNPWRDGPWSKDSLASTRENESDPNGRKNI